MTPEIQTKLITWLLSDDTGCSSKAIVAAAVGAPCEDIDYHPSDPADFGRCARLLEAIPELREPAFAHLKEHGGEVWSRIIDHWDQIHTSMEEEVGIDWSKARSAPNTYWLMQRVQRGTEPQVIPPSHEEGFAPSS